MSPKTWIIKDLLKVTADYLKKKQIESPRLTSELLLAHQLQIDRVALYLNFDKPLNEQEISGYRSYIRRRVQREPLQYITGEQGFWSMDFIVDPRVLIPRPESELLVEQALKRFREIYGKKRLPLRILDLGTGCGAIAISLAKELNEAQVWATDISSDALEVSRLNAEKHGMSDRIEFRQGDLWQSLKNHDIAFDIIVSNPPYVSPEAYNDLPPEVRDFEPRLALDGRGEGMLYVEKIINGGAEFLNRGGWLMIEMAPDQTEPAIGLVDRTFDYEERNRIKDYSRRYRIVCARKTMV